MEGIVRYVPEGAPSSYGTDVSLWCGWCGDVLECIGSKRCEDTLNQNVLFQKEFLEQTKNILYRSYVDWVSANAPNIDSVLVKTLYKNGLYGGEYIKPKQAVFTEIRSDNEQIIQKIYKDFTSGVSFDDLVVGFGGSLKKPLYEGSGGVLGEVLFTLVSGEVSSPIKNQDRTFSIVRLERFVDSIPFELHHVYSQIEQKIKKERLDSLKNNLSLGLGEKFNLSLFKEVLSF